MFMPRLTSRQVDAAGSASGLPLSVKKLKNYCVVDRWAIPVSLLGVGHAAQGWVAFVGVDRPLPPKSCLFDLCL
ncbi:hypothetical protein BHE90_009764 [Fusarium euwallaceae]|uniref:Uncharacterized protein n=4 Tax=Fusarium solani species complex TaxID=232080 RepID=A0A3M2RNH4_9HYPO|nr:hypothetical protein CDV36_013650 [Fusarium kuroshium]RSL75365.1 hypothetical protein CEP51_010932 [Fusarium floridanum]RSM16266.1 hypothetical protein CEP52_000170 [Fusarium oligoseptatum]RTE75784.1 hypothetical protein BHE90_009764 [Fusarium euwallaceae]